MRLVAVVRNWLTNEVGLALPGPSRVYDSFSVFMGENCGFLIGKGFSEADIRDLQINELTKYMREWLLDSRPRDDQHAPRVVRPP